MCGVAEAHGCALTVCDGKFRTHKAASNVERMQVRYGRNVLDCIQGTVSVEFLSFAAETQLFVETQILHAGASAHGLP
jgi:hypothetical protein